MLVLNVPSLTNVLHAFADCNVINLFHELCHSFGMHHEQTRLDRDDHISIRLQNVGKDFLPNFVTPDPAYFKNGRYPYDPMSIMHYDSYSYSSTGKKTMVVKDTFHPDFAQRWDLFVSLNFQFSLHKSSNNVHHRYLVFPLILCSFCLNLRTGFSPPSRTSKTSMICIVKAKNPGISRKITLIC